MDTVSNGLTIIMNNEIRRKKECIIAPASKLLGNILRIIQMNGYIGEFEYVDDGRAGKFKVQLLGRVNKCGSIRPRFHVKVNNIEKWEKMYLPSRNIGVLAISTSNGIISHKEAKNKGIGGNLLAFIY